ncbi:acyltransferase domain-containing protein, partial [Streptomyces scopuliridis]|uniref:acyltransferase domain-containing protein n=1 Tax=Streptomyces scopuliridis TaxID=452529 RepID=UPI001F0CAE6E
MSGVLGLSDAVGLVVARAGLMQGLPRGGAMVAVGAAESVVAAQLTGREGEVSIAAVNGPESVVISGDESAVVEVAGHFEGLGRRTSRLKVSHAFHSPHMDAMLEEFRTAAKRVSYGEPGIPVVSTLTGRLASGDDLRTADYWVEQVRHAVRFAEAVTTLHEQGATTFVEIGPDRVLAALAQGILTELPGAAPTVLALLGRDQPEAHTLVAGLGALHRTGARPDWPAFYAPTGARRVELPTYAFQHRRYWVDAAETTTDATGLGLEPAEHPLLGAALLLDERDEAVFTSRLSARTHPWLTEHTVGGTAVLPVAAVVELGIRAGDEVGCTVLDDLTVETPLVLPADGGVQLRVTVGAPDASGHREFACHARPDGTGASWVRHAHGRLGGGPLTTPRT